MTTINEGAVSAGTLTDAMVQWDARREALVRDRARLITTAWDSGVRNVSAVAKLMGISRGTVYNDLKSNGRIAAQVKGGHGDAMGQVAYFDEEIDIARAIREKNRASSAAAPVRMKVFSDAFDVISVEIDNDGAVRVAQPDGATPIVDDGFFIGVRLAPVN